MGYTAQFQVQVQVTLSYGRGSPVEPSNRQDTETICLSICACIDPDCAVDAVS